MSAEQIIVPTAKALTAAISVHGNQAVLHLSEPREYVAFSAQEPAIIGAQLLGAAVDADPSQGQFAINTALATIDAIYEAHPLLKGAGWNAKQELIDRHRRTITKRIEVVLNSMREKKRVDNPQLAKELAEIALREVFT